MNRALNLGALLTGIRKKNYKFDLTELYTWRAHTGSINSMEVNNNSKLLITTSTDCCARLWTWQGCFIGTFGQPIEWDIAHAISEASTQMGPFDVLVDPQTQNVPEYQGILVETSQKGVSVQSGGRWGDPDFEKYTKELFGEPLVLKCHIFML